MVSLFRKPKREPQDVAAFLDDHSEQIHGSLCVFGDWFGRPMDNWHRLVSHEATQDHILLTFNEGETLEVWGPDGLRFDGSSFIIERADRVRWEWFYYGRDKLPENRFYVEHVSTADGVSASSDVDWARHDFRPSRSKPAVSIT